MKFYQKIWHFWRKKRLWDNYLKTKLISTKPKYKQKKNSSKVLLEKTKRRKHEVAGKLSFWSLKFSPIVWDWWLQNFCSNWKLFLQNDWKRKSFVQKMERNWIRKSSRIWSFESSWANFYGRKFPNYLYEKCFLVLWRRRWLQYDQRIFKLFHSLWHHFQKNLVSFDFYFECCFSW